MSIARFGDTLATRELTGVSLPDTVYVGLFVCAHNDSVVERAEFSNVRITTPPPATFVPYRDYLGSHLEILDLASGKLAYFGDGGNWDVESIALSPDGRVLAVTTNEAGIGVLRLYDAATRKPLPRPALPTGNVRGLVWHENSRDLAVSVNSAQSPGDAYAIDVRDNVVTRWTQTSVAGLDAAAFRGAETIEWKSFDGRIGGFDPAATTDKTPSSSFTANPSQARPGFMGRWNYFITARRRDHRAERPRVDRLR
jgi:WD40 repeat protein